MIFAIFEYHIFECLLEMFCTTIWSSCDDTNFGFSNRNRSFLLVQLIFFVVNFYVSKSKFERIVFEFYNLVYQG